MPGRLQEGACGEQAYGEGEGHFLPSLQYIPGFSEFLLMARDRGPGPLISGLSGLRDLTFLLELVRRAHWEQRGLESRSESPFAGQGRWHKRLSKFIAGRKPQV